MKRLLSVLLILIFVLGLFGCRAEEPNELIGSEPPAHSGTEVALRMLRYNWDGYGIAQKAIATCDLAYAIIDCLSKLRETGESSAKISDETLDDNVGELSAERGTVWIECGIVGTFRLNPEMKEICRVDSHLGEGRVLEMTDVLEGLLCQAWYYHPNDCWTGNYKNGKISLNHIYKTESAVEWVRIDSIHVKNEPHSKNNKIELTVFADESKRVCVILESYQSNDNLAGGDLKEIDLVSGKETSFELTFGGFYNYPYQITVTIDNTKVTLTIDPRG